MAANRRDYFREYKRRQREGRRLEGHCIDCGADTEARRYFDRIKWERAEGRYLRCKKCRRAALASLRRAGHLLDSDDPASVRRFLKRARQRLDECDKRVAELQDAQRWYWLSNAVRARGLLRRSVQRLTEQLEFLKLEHLKPPARRAGTRRTARGKR
jgi:hypothetical protein